MAKRAKLVGHLEAEEIRKRYRECGDPTEKIRWLLILHLSQGEAGTVLEGAKRCGMNHSWACRLVKRYNEQGPEALTNGHKRNGSQGLLSAEDQAALGKAIGGQAPDGGLWTGPKVAAWMSQRLERPVNRVSAWGTLRRLAYTLQIPRPRHQKAASKEEQAAYKKSSAKTLPSSKRKTPIRKSSFGPKTKRG